MVATLKIKPTAKLKKLCLGYVEKLLSLNFIKIGGQVFEIHTYFHFRKMVATLETNFWL